MDGTEEEETQRLRRHLRAMSAVNRSLHAQLEGRSVHVVGPSEAEGDLLARTDVHQAALPPRRLMTASAWVEQLQVTSGGGEPYLVWRSGAVFLVEGRYGREVRSGLLTAALSEYLGEPRDITEEELEGLDEGVPVELLEGPRGRPFVVVGGQRLSIRGLPLPYPVSTEEMQLFPEGPELNVASANVPRAKFEGAYSGRYQLSQARAAVARKGVIPAAAAFGRRAWRRLGGSSRG